MKKIIVILTLFICCQPASAQIPGTGDYGLIESLSPGGGAMSGPFAYSVCTQTADDTTPDMGSLPGGCNILETSDANTGATAITDLDGPVLPGMIIWIIGKGGANPTTIADSGNFNLETAWSGATDRVLGLYVQAVGDFVEIGRIGGDRVFEAGVDIRGLIQQGDGTYSWGHSPTSAGFEGKVEFDNYCYFDSNMYVYNAMYIQQPSGFIGYDGGFTQIRQSVNDGLLIALYASAATYHNMIISSQANALKNHDHTQQTNPTLHIHSVTNPDINNTRYLSLYHDGTTDSAGSGYFTTGSGTITLGPAGNAVIPDADNDVDLGSSAASWKDFYADGACYCGTVTVTKFTRYVDIEAGFAALPPTGPSTGIVGTYFVLEFDADAEAAYFSNEVPTDWAGATDDDYTLKIYWTNQPGDAIADGETVKWDISYRVTNFDGGEVVDNGSATTGTVTYTQSGAGTDKETHVSSITIDADDANNALVKGQVLGIVFDRDVSTDTYSGKANVIRWEIAYPSTTFKEH